MLLVTLALALPRLCNSAIKPTGPVAKSAESTPPTTKSGGKETEDEGPSFPGDENGYVGIQACTVCHKKRVSDFLDSRHGKRFINLFV